MNYQRFTPPAALQAYVRFYWIVENRESTAAPRTFGPIADGCPGMLIQQSESGTFYGSQNDPFPRLFLYGQTITPIRIHATGAFRTMGIYFYPDALKTIFGLDAEELTNGCVDLTLLPEAQTYRLSERLMNGTSPQTQMSTVSTYLLAQIRKRQGLSDGSTQYALSRLLRSQGMISLKALQEEIRLSERSMERRFKQWVGISPKLFSRVCRFQAARHQLRTGIYDKLSDVAFDHAYADQSHFIRSFKEFTGFTPYQYRKQSREVIESFPELIR